MKFVLGIKPNVFSGYGTLKDARNHIDGVFCLSSSFGVGYENSIRKATAVYGYNIEVFKRGKHRRNKHYVIYRYTFPIEMFKLLNVEIKQGSRTFKIMPKKSR
jgi:ribosomal protein L19